MAWAASSPRFQHDFRDYHFMSADRHLIVEGTTCGRMKNGKTWAAGKRRRTFLQLFLNSGATSSPGAHILDPDYVSEDHPRFLWGLDGRTW